MFSTTRNRQSLPRHFSHRDSYSNPFTSILKIKLSLRSISKEILSKPLFYFLSIIISLLFFSWSIGLTSNGNERIRKSGERVVVRNWNDVNLMKVGGGGGGLKGDGLLGGGHKGGEMVLILCPMKNSIEHIWHFFSLLDSLSYPRHLIQIGILVSDSTDKTYTRAIELADERQYTFGKKGKGGKGRYDKISVYNKDFMKVEEEENSVGKGENDESNVGEVVIDQIKKVIVGGGGGREGGGVEVGEGNEPETPSKIGSGLSNIGTTRHDFSLQIKRRKLLAKSRSWLLESSLVPEIDYVLWIDVDVIEFEKTLIQTLMKFSKEEEAEVVVPNCMWKSHNEMGSYDRNNWAETPESLAMKLTLKPSDVLIEGYATQLLTYRLNMADLYPLPPNTPEIMKLDGVGGCTALVKASIHREGAIFPAWNVDHQLETEGFAQIVKELGGKMIGLTGYYVYHGLYG